MQAYHFLKHRSTHRIQWSYCWLPYWSRLWLMRFSVLLRTSFGFEEMTLFHNVSFIFSFVLYKVFQLSIYLFVITIGQHILSITQNERLSERKWGLHNKYEMKLTLKCQWFYILLNNRRKLCISPSGFIAFDHTPTKIITSPQIIISYSLIIGFSRYTAVACLICQLTRVLKDFFCVVTCNMSQDLFRYKCYWKGHGPNYVNNCEVIFQKPIKSIELTYFSINIKDIRILCMLKSNWR